MHHVHAPTSFKCFKLRVQVITRQTEELTALKALLAEKEAALAASLTENTDLVLRASIGKAHRIMFDDPWIVETTHHRCKGEALPLDREGQTLLALPGGLRCLTDSSIKTHHTLS
jgi:hypothetical protein